MNFEHKNHLPYFLRDMEFSKDVENIAFVLNLTNEVIHKECWSSSFCEFSIWSGDANNFNIGAVRFSREEIQIKDKTLGLLIPAKSTWYSNFPLNIVFQKVITFDFINTFKSKKELSQAIYTKLQGFQNLPDLYQEISAFFENKSYVTDFGKISICINDYFGKLSLVTILYHSNISYYYCVYYKLIETDKPFSEFY